MQSSSRSGAKRAKSYAPVPALHPPLTTADREHSAVISKCNIKKYITTRYIQNVATSDIYTYIYNLLRVRSTKSPIRVPHPSATADRNLPSTVDEEIANEHPVSP